MQDLSRDLLQMQYNADLLELLGTLKEWHTKNEELLLPLIQCTLRIDTYVKTMQNERYFFDKLIGENVSDKCRAVERARKSEERIEELETEIRELKLKLEILT